MNIVILVLISIFSVSSFASNSCLSEINNAVKSITNNSSYVEKIVYLGDANLGQTDGRRTSNLSTFSVLANIDNSEILFLAVVNTVNCDVITAVEIGPRK
jgi:hypothetical protein